jgi:hypothetical protein
MMSHPTEGILLHESTETLCHANYTTKVGDFTQWNTIQMEKTPLTQESADDRTSITTQELKMTHNIRSRF